MKIDGNKKEKAAMKAYFDGKHGEYLRLQGEFVEEFKRVYAKKDHCSCPESCRYHGDCKVCVAIHRAHREHLPYCMQVILKENLSDPKGLIEE